MLIGARLRCFHRSSWTDVHQTSSKYRTISGLYDSIFIRIATASSRTLLLPAQYCNRFGRGTGKIDTPVFILCAGIRQSQWENFTPDQPSTSIKNFLNFGSVTFEIFVSLQGWVRARSLT